MSRVTRSVLVRAPQTTVAASLRSIAEAADHGGVPRTFALRAPVRLSSLDAEIVLTGETTAHLGAAHDERGAFCAVAWEPANGDSFPRFADRMWSDVDTLCSSWLRLDGEYESQDEHARLTDRGERTIGHRIALATAKRLLDEVAAEIGRLRAT